MTRRARMGPIQTLGRGVDRMAPGGRRSAAESPVRPFYRPVGEAGEAEPEPVPGPPECVSLSYYPHVYTPDPSSVAYSGGFIMPRAVGMPVTESSDPLVRMGGFSNNANLGTAVALGPPLGGSAHSYQHTGTSDATGFGLALYGGSSNPVWSGATHLRASGWGNHALFGTGFGLHASADFYFSGIYGTGTDSWFYYRVRCSRSPAPRTWTVSFWGFGPTTQIVVPEFAGIDPFIDNQPVFYSLDVDTTTNTLTVTVNSTVWSYTGPGVWQTPAWWAGRLSDYAGDRNVSVFLSYDADRGIPGPTTGWFSDLTIDTDAPWCNY